MKKMFRRLITLRFLIIFVALTMMILTLLNSFYSAWRVQKQILIANELGVNQSYAEKIASELDLYLAISLERLSHGASVIEQNGNNPQAGADELNHIQQHNIFFDSIFLTNQEGRAIGSRPPPADPIALPQPTPDAARIQTLKPTISSLYQAPSGRLAIHIFYPLSNPYGNYPGSLGEIRYLQQEYILSLPLNIPFHNDQENIYILDKNGRLLYSPEKKRIGEKEKNSAIITAINHERSGAIETVNARGIAMLTGYATVLRSGWRVVAQTPKDRTLSALDGLMRQMILGTLPLGIVGLFILWLLASEIVKPLHQLTTYATCIYSDTSAEQIRKIRSWYVEVVRLKLALLRGMGLVGVKMKWLNEQAYKDPLTGLYNRRAAEKTLAAYEQQNLQFSVVALDIDHFKLINDSYGHDVGDLTLKALAHLLNQHCRKSDIACRMGGEEFMLFFPETATGEALEIAERLRKEVDNMQIEAVGHVTISLGITSWPSGDDSVARTLKRVDGLMYQAKRAGRNRVISG